MPATTVHDVRYALRDALLAATTKGQPSFSQVGALVALEGDPEAESDAWDRVIIGEADDHVYPEEFWQLGNFSCREQYTIPIDISVRTGGANIDDARTRFWEVVSLAIRQVPALAMLPNVIEALPAGIEDQTSGSPSANVVAAAGVLRISCYAQASFLT